MQVSEGQTCYDFKNESDCCKEFDDIQYLRDYGPFLALVGKQCFQAKHFLFKTQHIRCKQAQIQIRSLCLLPNGQPLAISSAYCPKIFQLANYNSQNFSFSKDRKNQIQLYSVLSSVFASSNQSLNNSLQKIFLSAVSAFQNALQIVGYSQKFNKNQLLLKAKQLKLKKAVIKAIRKKSQKSLQFYPLQAEKNIQNTSVQKVISIQELSDDNEEETIIKNGGYLSVSMKKCLISRHESQKEKIQVLAAKKPKNSSKIHANSIQEKLSKEIQFVKKVANQQYLGTYYECQNNSDSLYMNYIPNILKDFIYQYTLGIEQLVNIGYQLVEGVSFLHHSGIVHRDLKPQNILVEIKDKKKFIKIIDFGQSTQINEQCKADVRLGCTMPYSPPQCFLGSPEGRNKKQIDYWSIIMILYEMTFKSLPFTFSRILGGDIVESWKDPQKFCIFPVCSKKNGLRGCEEIISLMTVAGLKISQNQRLNLESIGSILKQLQNYETDCSNLILNSL